MVALTPAVARSTPQGTKISSCHWYCSTRKEGVKPSKLLVLVRCLPATVKADKPPIAAALESTDWSQLVVHQ